MLQFNDKAEKACQEVKYISLRNTKTIRSICIHTMISLFKFGIFEMGIK